MIPPSSLITFCRAESIELAIVFGSQAKGTVHAAGDLDLAVAFEEGRDFSKLRLIFDLEGIFHPRTVDVVILTPETPPLLLYEIFFRGRVLYESREGLFDKGRLRAWKLYLDSAQLRVREAQYLREFVRRMRNVA